MLHRRIRRIIKIYILILTVLSLVSIYTLNKQVGAEQVNKHKALPYKMLRDDMQTKIVIGVDSTVDEEQLRATLAKAADEHQNDAARDYLISDYLWVEGFLLDQDKQSIIPAGTLRRYVPPKSGSQEHRDWLDWLPDLIGKRDGFTITLEDAKRTLH